MGFFDFLKSEPESKYSFWVEFRIIPSESKSKIDELANETIQLLNRYQNCFQKSIGSFTLQLPDKQTQWTTLTISGEVKKSIVDKLKNDEKMLRENIKSLISDIGIKCETFFTGDNEHKQLAASSRTLTEDETEEYRKAQKDGNVFEFLEKLNESNRESLYTNFEKMTGKPLSKEEREQFEKLREEIKMKPVEDKKQSKKEDEEAEAINRFQDKIKDFHKDDEPIQEDNVLQKETLIKIVMKTYAGGKRFFVLEENPLFIPEVKFQALRYAAKVYKSILQEQKAQNKTHKK